MISCFLGLIYDGLSMEVKFEGTLVQKPIVNAFTRWFSFSLLDGLVIVCIIIFLPECKVLICFVVCNMIYWKLGCAVNPSGVCLLVT